MAFQSSMEFVNIFDSVKKRWCKNAWAVVNDFLCINQRWAEYSRKFANKKVKMEVFIEENVKNKGNEKYIPSKIAGREYKWMTSKCSFPVRWERNGKVSWRAAVRKSSVRSFGEGNFSERREGERVKRRENEGNEKFNNIESVMRKKTTGNNPRINCKPRKSKNKNERKMKKNSREKLKISLDLKWSAMMRVSESMNLSIIILIHSIHIIY